MPLSRRTDSMPQPPLVFLLADKTPHFIHLGFTGSLNVYAGSVLKVEMD